MSFVHPIFFLFISIRRIDEAKNSLVQHRLIKNSLLIFFAVYSTVSSAQIENKGYNFGFERRSINGNLPDGWIQLGADYSVQVDNQIFHSGKSSVVITRSEESNYASSSGSITCTIPVNFDATEIELKAFVKLTNVTDGKAGLILRIDDDFGLAALENQENKSIQGTKDWAQFSIKIPYPESAKSIMIGAVLEGNGQLWVDDFEILLDGKDIRTVKEKPKKKALLDKEFDTGSKISSIDISPLALQHLDVLGKVWGFLKYYHPAVITGNYNWDYELFRILPLILEAKNEKQRNTVLKTWIENYGNVQTAKDNNDIIKAEVKLRPDLTWINQELLGKDIVGLLSKIKRAKRARESYYIEKKFEPWGPQLKNEETYSTTSYPDIGFRLLALYRYWNFIHYYFPYKHLIGEDWKNVLPEYIPKFLKAGNELEYQQVVLSLIARIHDTHANIWGGANALMINKGEKCAPLEVTFIDGKAVVTDYRDESLARKSGIQIGDVIEFVDGKAVTEIVKEKLLLTPASNYPTQLRDLARDLLRTPKPTMEIKYFNGKEMASSEIETSFPYFFAKHDNYHKEDTCFKLIDSNIAYLYPGVIKNEFLPKIMAEVKKTKGLIIDFRCYPSAFLVFTLSDYLLPEAKSFAKFTTPDPTIPGSFFFAPEKTVGRMNDDYYKGKIVIIINEQTQSQAEYTVMALRTAPRATVIGSTTAGADGDLIRFSLPGGIVTAISGYGVYYPDGRETQRIGILPDIEVKRTLKGVREKRDELLEKAILIIKNE